MFGICFHVFMINENNFSENEANKWIVAKQYLQSEMILEMYWIKIKIYGRKGWNLADVLTNA